jgi:hydrogenase maturation factor
MLLPKNIKSVQLSKIAHQIDKATRELGIAIIGGHTEITPGITRPILVATTLGEAEKENFVTSSEAKMGDQIIVTKGAAIEATAILSTEFEEFLEAKVGVSVVTRGQKFIKMISVVKDALTAMEVGGVHAMHDATEGGIAGGLQEIAWASNVGIEAYEEKIPIREETRKICGLLNIDPLRTISSGALIISALPEKAAKIVTALEGKGINASIIGQVVKVENGSYIHRTDGSKLNLSETVKEELWKALDALKTKAVGSRVEHD